MRRATGTFVLVALAACGPRVRLDPVALGPSPATIIHEVGRLRCPGDLGANIDWSPGSEATRIRGAAVEAMVRDTIMDAGNGLADPGWWCVLTDTTGWKVPPGVRVERRPPITKRSEERTDCRLLEIDPFLPLWQTCTFDGRPVQVIEIDVRWYPVRGENVSTDWRRGIFDLADYGAFQEGAPGGRPSLARIRQHEF
jgi:hypothetical protein